MYCPDCGLLNRSGAKFCSACQTPLDGASAAWLGPLQPNQIMDNGRYRIIRPLGKGGMGAVYLAENLQAFGREVVIKEMIDYFDPADPQQAEQARQRFEQEARILAALKHPSVPDIYGYFSQGGRNCLVMEFVVGESLRTGVTHRDSEGTLVPALPYTQEQILHFGVQLCDLLDYLASRRDPDTAEPRPVIHQDIKPANILRDPETDRVWLVDFGAARARLTGSVTDRRQPSTDDKSIYGTVGYAPPEQYNGESVLRSDVYALAATLYHLLTNDDPQSHPFEFDQFAGLPIRLRVALTNALALDVKERSTAAAFRAALASCLPDQSPKESQPLVFPEAKAARKLSDIPLLARDYWDYTRDILYSGDLEHWLRRSLHNPVVAEAAKRISSSGLDQDAGLDTFLRELDPRFPSGHLRIPHHSLDMGIVASRQKAVGTVTIANSGHGHSHGTISSSASWLAESDNAFSVGPGKSENLVIEADTSQLSPGRHYRETLTLTPADGSKPLHLDVVLRVAEPRIMFNPQRLVFDIRQGDAGVKEVHFTNTGGDKVSCTLTRDEQWLLVRPKELDLLAGQAAKTAVTVRSDRLPPLPRPRAHLTLTPSHGRPITIPVEVVAGSPILSGRLLVVLLAAILAGLLVWGGIALSRSGWLASSGQPAETPVSVATAEELDAEMVLVESFRVDRFEVTNLQYARYDPVHYFDPGDELLPVVNVTWDEARGYCQWAGKRLPTEAEWELAAAGAEGRTYPWGDEPDHSRLNSADTRGNSRLMPVDSFPSGSTPGGINNLLGNASEWVIGSPEHPQAHRGGSYLDSGLTNSRDFWAGPGFTAATVGFRCSQDTP